MSLLITFISLLTSVLTILTCTINLSYCYLSKKNKIFIFLIILIHISLTIPLGNITIIPMLLFLALYLYFFSEHSIKNLYTIPLSYIISVLSCNFCTLLLRALFHISFQTLANHLQYFIILAVGTLLFGTIISYCLGKILRTHLSKLSVSIYHRESLILIISHICLCTVIYVFNVIWGQKVGYTDANTTFNTILFILYFMSSTFILILTFLTYAEKNKQALKETQYNNLQEYTAKVETMYSNLRAFKHDYINILSSLLGFIESKDYDGLEKYFNETILPTKKQINAYNYQLSQLKNIQIIALKGSLSSKFIHAQELGVRLFIDIADPVESISIDVVDLLRILGIFLDNAIEGALETNCPQLNFNIVISQVSVVIITKNNFINQDISLSKITNLSVSTKGPNRGLGLYNAKQILKSYTNIIHETSIHDNFFVQTLEIIYT